MKYQVLVLRSAEKELVRLPDNIRKRVAERIVALGVSPRPVGSRKLSDREEYRIRIGDYRVLYTVDDTAATVTIAAIGHRKDIYH